jgi:uncharacterized phage protein gp47/JayE
MSGSVTPNSTSSGASLGCCSSPKGAPATPVSRSNAPGLSTIQYRIGTFASFRRAMLDKVAFRDLMVGGANPFAGWHEGIDGDYQTMFIELWAYLADILAFYQERFANEAFITTATQRDSLLRLVRLIDYRPSPGSGAGGLVTFTVAKDASLTVPAEFRVGSRAQSGRPAAVFETSSAITAFGDNSAIGLSPVSPDVDFPQNTIVLQGVNNRLEVGDYVLAVEDETKDSEAPNLLQLTAVEPNRKTNTTTISWQQVDGGYNQASKQVTIYAFRVTAAPFGSTAPRWDTLSPALTNIDGQHPNPPYPDNWDLAVLRILVDSIRADGQPIPGLDFLRPNPWFYIPTPGDLPNVVYLDGLYSGIKDSPLNPGWAALFAEGQNNFQVLRVTEARQASKVAYAISVKATRLTFAEAESVIPSFFPLRNTIILTGSERLAVQSALRLPDTVSGNTLVLAGVHSQLQAGQTVILQGNEFDSKANPPTETLTAESGILDRTPLFDPVYDLTTVTLRSPLANEYVRSSCSLMANVVEVTHGETVKDEVLGSSDGSAFQSYRLKQGPLTYQPSTDPESVAGVQSTLLVAVNGVRWTELPTLVESAPDDQSFTTSLDDSGQTSVIFGDGFSGTRPSSGINNIHARYRKGLGTSGNLPSGSIQQMIDSVPGLQKVTNPVPSSGGGDPENITQIRRRAPASLQTFGRAVSVVDYVALALSYPGIAKAGSTWVAWDSATLQSIARPYVQLTFATVDRVPTRGTVFAGKLRRFLDDHRDPNVPLRIQDFSPVYVAVAVDVDIDDHFPHQATLAQVQSVLNPGSNPDGSLGYFAFERLDFGQSIYLSAVYAVVQGVPGIKDAAITSLTRTGPPPADPLLTPPHDIFVGPTEIVIVDPTEPNQGSLTISGQGGFRDT